ncbi:MAG: NAD(P)H-hydrate dehydratase [Balneolaceae bacterium]|nr:NAD(P)H-hydrate dehydratase [Balneolaceae bacterium]
MSAFRIPHSHFLCTAAQSQQMDRSTIEDFGIDGYTLMEVAGSSAAKELLNDLSPQSHGIYLCGKGNNAGDALVMARYLVQHGHPATLVFISGTGDLSTDAEKNWSLLKKIAEFDSSAADIVHFESWNEFQETRVDTVDFIVDGMLGTGLDSNLRGDYINAVRWASQSGHPVYAVDIPTGLHADSGQIMGEAIHASVTFSFGTLKIGFYLENGPEHCGDIRLFELPFPYYLKQCNSYLLDRSWVPKPEYGPSTHKYEAGILYIIAGSEGLTGAAIMSARSAWAEGIGAVIVVCPRGILQVFENTLPQIIKKPVGSPADPCFKEEHLEEVLETVEEKRGTVLFGPGIGRDASTRSFASSFFDRFDGHLLIDADGLWCLAQDNSWQKPEGAEWILTPHPGELSRLTTDDFSSGSERLQAVRALSTNKEVTMVSKGYPAVVGTPGGDTLLTGYDTRIFARAGFGDVLAGKIGAYWAMGSPAAESAALGLLDGYDKVKGEFIDNNHRHPEPNDLI